MTVLLATPVGPAVNPAVLVPYSFLIHHSASVGIQLIPSIATDGDLAMARNNLVHTALDLDVTHIFWLDSDILPPPNAIQQLLSNNLSVVGGLYFQRGLPVHPVVFNLDPFEIRDDIDTEKVSKVEGMGQGCLLVSTDIYKMQQKVYGDDYWYLLPPGSTEDIFFFTRLKEMRLSAYLDPSVRCGHVGSYVYSFEDWRRE